MANNRKPGRPRSEDSHQAVLVAAMEILKEEGYSGLTLQNIARKAGVGHQTLYRWWDSKADIALEAFAERTSHDVPIPDTGSVKNDLIELIETSGQAIREFSGPIVLGLVAEAALDEKFAAKFWQKFQLTRRKVLSEILTRGIKRGELPPDLDQELWADLVFGSLIYRLFSRNAPIEREFGKKLAELLPVE